MASPAASASGERTNTASLLLATPLLLKKKLFSQHRLQTHNHHKPPNFHILTRAAGSEVVCSGGIYPFSGEICLPRKLRLRSENGKVGAKNGKREGVGEGGGEIGWGGGHDDVVVLDGAWVGEIGGHGRFKDVTMTRRPGNQTGYGMRQDRGGGAFVFEVCFSPFFFGGGRSASRNSFSNQSTSSPIPKPQTLNPKH